MFWSPGALPAYARPRAILLDALGTLVSLDPPAPRLRAGLLAALGVDVGAGPAARAMRAEIRFYRAHLHEASDAAGLDHLRRRCASLVKETLGLAAAAADVVEPVLLDALRFEAFPDAAPALRELRGAGLRLVVVSNWDVSLHEVLARTGLRPLVDAAVSSAEAGSAKPDPRIFARALSLAGTTPGETWHVGDSFEADVRGAQRAGIAPVLIDREGGAPALRKGEGRRIGCLAELAPLVGAGEPYPPRDGRDETSAP